MKMKTGPMMASISISFPRLKVVLAFTALTLLCIMSHSASVQAAPSSEFLNSSNTYHPTDPASDVYASVAWRGSEDTNGDGTIDKSIGLEARVSIMRIFYKVAGSGATSRNTFSIRIIDACRPSHFVYDGQMVVSIQRLDPFGNAINLPGRTNIPNSGGNCSGHDMVFTVNRSELSWLPDYYGSEYQVVQVRAEKVNGIGTKWFRVRSEDDGSVTFGELNRAATANPGDPGYGTAFSMQDSRGAASKEREYMFEFSPDCHYVSQYGNNAYLKWFDADFGDGNELGTNNIHFTITRRNNGVVTWQQTIDHTTSPDIGGDDTFREMIIPVTGTGDVFEWHWYNVNRPNGIQLWMPFSEMQRYISGLSGCDEPPQGGVYEANCNVISGWALDPDRPNNPVEVIVTVDGPYGQGNEVGRVTANQPDSGGRGNHAFSLPYNGPKDASTHPLYIYIVGLNDNGMPSVGDPFLVTDPPITIPVCTPPEQFWLEPVVTSVEFEDGESPGVVRFNSLIDPRGYVPPDGIPAIVERTFVFRRANGQVTNFQVGKDIDRFDFNDQIFNDSFDTAGLNVQPGDMICLYVFIYNTYNGYADIYGNVTQVLQASKTTDELCRRIVNKPYVKAYGGDVWAGGDFGSSSCSPTKSGDNPTIKTFARQLSVGRARGSSTEYAAFAMGQINGDASSKGFYSSSQRNNLMLPFPVTGLTFANTTTAWGGDFGPIGHCIPDFSSISKLDPNLPVQLQTSINVAALGDGQYRYQQPAGGQPIELVAGAQLSNRVTIFVEGDVFLRGGLAGNPGFQYRTTGWATNDDIPAFILIVKNGNIFIDYRITQLDGVLIAQHDSSSTATREDTGIIFTCADPVTRSFMPSGTPPEQNRFSDTVNGCGKQLIVNGALVARDVRMQRAVHSLRDALQSPDEDQANTRAAEVVNLLPELYLAQPALRPSVDPSGGTYDSVTTLPPIF